MAQAGQPVPDEGPAASGSRRTSAYSDAGRRGLLDVYLPADGEVENAPVLLQVHGGGWTIGNKDQQGIPLMQHLAAKGWVCVAINYRLAPRDPFPAHVIDVKKAIAWIRENIAEYGGNPDYIAITGGSAGGHLTALAALTANDPAYQPGFEDADTTVQVAVPHYGVYDFAGSTGLRSAELLRDGFLAPRILQKTWADSPDEFEAASPILRITEDAPDFFVLHGKHDTLVPVDQARLFVEQLRADLQADRRVRRAPRRPARVRRVPVDPVGARRAGDRPVPPLALEHLAGRRPHPGARGREGELITCAALSGLSCWSSPSPDAAATPASARPTTRSRRRPPYRPRPRPPWVRSPT